MQIRHLHKSSILEIVCILAQSHIRFHGLSEYVLIGFWQRNKPANDFVSRPMADSFLTKSAHTINCNWAQKIASYHNICVCICGNSRGHGWRQSRQLFPKFVGQRLD